MTKKLNTKSIWITWEHHRRSREIASHLCIPLLVLNCPGPYSIKIIVNSIRTIIILLYMSPKMLIVQNPSMFLTFLVCCLKKIFNYRLVVDRHSNFKFEKIRSRSLKYKIFHTLSRFTVRKADMTIITNKYLYDIVEEWGGRGFILEDPLPHLEYLNSKRFTINTTNNIVFICSFSNDEPVDEVLKASQLLKKDATIYVTGRVPKNFKPSSNSRNVVFTGYLEEESYQSLINACDIVLVLTTKGYILLCGAYEALAAHKPLILSDTACLRNYFGGGAVFAENSAESIVSAIHAVLSEREAYIEKVRILAAKLHKNWLIKRDDLKKLLKSE